MRTLYVKKRGSIRHLYCDDLPLAVYPTEREATEAALGMVNRWPDKYSILIIEDEGDPSKQHQGKRRDQVEYSLYVLVGVGIGMALCAMAFFLTRL